MAEITTTQTMGSKTITTTINTGARGPQGIQGPQGEIGPEGPQGPAGATGPAGSDAEVTQANMEAAITDAGAFRESISSQSSAVGFLNRFGRLANGTAVPNGSAPEIGENIYLVNGSTRSGGVTTSGSANISFSSSGVAPIVGSTITGTGIPAGTTILSSTTTTAVLSANATADGSGLTFTLVHPSPTVQNEALEAAAGTLIYYGANVAAPGNRFTITIMAEIRINAGYTSGVTAPDLTIGVNAKPWSAAAGLANFLNTPQCLHAQIRTTGAVGGDFYSEAPTIAADDSTDTALPIGAGFKFPITIDVDGPNDICRITVAGRTHVFRDSRYSRCVDEASTGFFVEWEAPTSAYQYYWAVHSIAVNAPELSDSNSFEGGQYGRAMHDLMTRGTATLPSRPRILGGQVAFNASQGAQSTNDPIAIAGNGHLGYAPYARPAPFIESRFAGIIQRSTAALTSNASASDQSIHTLSRLEELAGFTGNQLAAGAWMRTTYLFRLGANSNTKRIKIKRSAGGATRFDSGDLTDNGAQGTLTFYQIRLAAGYRFVTIMEWSTAGSTTCSRIQTYNADAGGAADQLLVTGTSAGDVTIDFHFTEINPVP